jgi:allophanate hydrolase subunit 2
MVTDSEQNPAVRLAVAGYAVTTRLRDGVSTVLDPWRSHTLRGGDVITTGAVRAGLRAIIAVAGGIDIEPQLGSRSVSLRGGTAGLLARALQRDDLLPVGGVAGGPDLELDPAPDLSPPAVLRILRGPQAEALDAAAWDALTRTQWRVGSASDRTALRLEGPTLALRGLADVAPQGCTPGAVQVTGDGAPMVLGCDCGTTGGYIVPAVVASVDRPAAGRLRPGAPLRLELIDLDHAREIRQERERAVARILAAVRPCTLPSG